jgi:hypothetical protein
LERAEKEIINNEHADSVEKITATSRGNSEPKDHSMQQARNTRMFLICGDVPEQCINLCSKFCQMHGVKTIKMSANADSLDGSIDSMNKVWWLNPAAENEMEHLKRRVQLTEDHPLAG